MRLYTAAVTCSLGMRLARRGDAEELGRDGAERGAERLRFGDGEKLVRAEW
jgi:hypothetical protein